MDSGDKKRFAAAMNGLAENFNAKVTQDGLRVRFVALAEYSISQVEQAAMCLIKTRTMMGMPAVAELIGAIQSGKPTIENQSVEQSTRVINAIRELGSYTHPKFKDPVTDALINSRWSWSSLCRMSERELQWWSKDFKAAYESMVEDGIEPMLDSGPELKLIVCEIGKGMP